MILLNEDLMQDFIKARRLKIGVIDQSRINAKRSQHLIIGIAELERQFFESMIGAQYFFGW